MINVSGYSSLITDTACPVCVLVGSYSYIIVSRLSVSKTAFVYSTRNPSVVPHIVAIRIVINECSYYVIHEHRIVYRVYSGLRGMNNLHTTGVQL